MPRILALDWDNHEVRYVLANTQGEEVHVQAASSFSYSESQETSEAQLSLGESIIKALAPLRVGRATVLVGVRRDNIELLHFSLPPTKDSELPELVRNLAIRESSLVSDDSLLDYVVCENSSSDQQQITAVALLPGEFDKINAVCKTAGITPQKMPLRPYAAASLFVHSSPSASENCLLVTRYTDEVDFVLLHKNTVSSWRTIHLPLNNEEAACKALANEIKRTLLLTSPDHTGDIQHIYVSGSSEENQELLKIIQQQLSLSVSSFDPFEKVDIPAENLPSSSARFTSLLGMILSEAHGTQQAIDFLDPKRQPTPFNYRRTSAIAASIVSLLLLILTYSTWSQLSAENQKIEERTQRLKELKLLVKKAAKQQQVTKALRQWRDNNVIWLDELRDFSLRFPTARDAVVLSMTQSRVRGGGGIVKLHCLVRDPLIVSRMESNLRDQYREVVSKNIQEIGPEKTHSWRFDTTISVTKREKELYLNQPSEKTPKKNHRVRANDSPAPRLKTKPSSEAKKNGESS